MSDAQKRKIFAYCEFMALQIYLRLKTIDDVKKDPKGVYRKIVEYYLAINHGIDTNGHPLKPKEEPNPQSESSSDQNTANTQDNNSAEDSNSEGKTEESQPTGENPEGASSTETEPGK